MEDSDDYFKDSFVLDEDDLAALAEQEEKYRSLPSGTSTSRISDSPPPAKRQRISHRDLTIDDHPDIILREDGTYGVRSSVNGGVKPTLIQRSSSTTHSQSNMNRSGLNGDKMKMSDDEPKSIQAGPRNLRNSRPFIAANDLITSKPIAVVKPSENLRELDLEKEIATLRGQLEIANQECTTTKEALKKAEITRYAKEGEVSILRKAIEKAAQQHSMDLANIRQTKETAETDKVRLQKEMRDQIERLRTEFVFKQHEIEGSARKTTWSARSRKTSIVPAPSPVALPADMRGWANVPVGSQMESNAVKITTPSHRSTIAGRSGFGKSPRVLLKPRLAAPEMKFPGFENSFLQVSPSKSPSRNSRLGRHGRETLGMRSPRRADVGRTSTPKKDKARPAVFSPVKVPPLSFEPSVPVNDDLMPIDDAIQDFDIEMREVELQKDIVEKNGLDPEFEDLQSIDDSECPVQIGGDTPLNEHFVGIDWLDELHFILLTHKHKPSRSLTLHFLLSVTIPEIEHELGQQYQLACTSILETLGMKYSSNLENLVTSIAENFIRMTHILWEVDLIPHLVALLELQTKLLLHIPSFTSAILLPVAEDPCPKKLTAIICCIVNDTTDGTRYASAEKDQLIHSLLSLVEVISWTILEAHVEDLAEVPKTDGVFMTLLNDSQTSMVIVHAIQTLVSLATHPSMIRHLTSAEGVTNQVPLLERLCKFLIEPGSLSNDVLPVRNVYERISTVLNFFYLVSIANSDARNVLVTSHTFVPSLIYYLSSLTSLVWEDEEAMRSEDVATSVVQGVIQGLTILHRLVFPPSSKADGPVTESTTDFDFRRKLYQAPHTLFNGLAHMFIVMIGRLSYADPPDWLASELQAQIESATEPARDLMDLIIEGPEGDSVWTAYQDVELDNTAEDMEEMEAQLLDGHTSA